MANSNSRDLDNRVAATRSPCVCALLRELGMPENCTDVRIEFRPGGLVCAVFEKFLTIGEVGRLSDGFVSADGVKGCRSFGPVTPTVNVQDETEN